MFYSAVTHYVGNYKMLLVKNCHLLVLAILYYHAFWNLCVCFYFNSIDSLPSISSVKFKDHLSMAVGTSTGQVCTVILILILTHMITFRLNFVGLSLCSVCSLSYSAFWVVLMDSHIMTSRN